MKLPIFGIKAGFVANVSPSAVEVEEPVFVYDTKNCEKIGILCEDGAKLSQAIGSMARLMGIPCIISITYIDPWKRQEPAAAFRVVVKLPYRLRRDAIEDEMEMKTCFGVVTVGFKGLQELTDALMDGK